VQVVTRKGLHRSLFSATKKWFGGGGGGGGGGGSSKAAGVGPSSGGADKSTTTNVVYTAEAPEMQQRRLADLAFMFHMYEMAYQTYTACRRDFNSDNAWLHFAGSLVRHLSLFLFSPSPSYLPYHLPIPSLCLSKPQLTCQVCYQALNGECMVIYTRKISSYLNDVLFFMTICHD
jgi:hypothetical protein